jgi:murein DD-endopeptidase MepM/ murein hydrolase activator NlpD
MLFSSFTLMFLQASITTLLTCTVAWFILRVTQRYLPSMIARRTPWLLAQLVGATTLIVVSSPVASQLSLFAIEQKPAVAELAKHMPAAHITEFVENGVNDRSSDDTLSTLAWVWLALYIIGATWYAFRLYQPYRTLRALMSIAERLDRQALHAHRAFSPHRSVELPVLEVEAPISPLLAGLIHPVLVLPSHMRKLPPVQQQLIVAHELMHLRRRDHLWQHASMLLLVPLWFIPSVYSFNRSLRWAVELGCDRAVLEDRSVSERRSYAAALLAQLTVQLKAGEVSPSASAVLAFGFHGSQSVAERIRLIRDAQPAPRPGVVGMTTLLLLPALCSASVLLQPQFAWNEPAQVSPETAHLASSAGMQPTGTAWRAPLARLYVTSSFGSINRPGGKPHNGMDFGAPRGTVVFTPANGRVVISTDRYEGGSRYGKVVVIEHDDGTRTLYAHLDGRTVRADQIVRAGQQIALSGATGKVTGPHLHFEVSRNGTHIDPQAVLDGVPLGHVDKRH